jgi:hypothetical protein
MRHHSRCSWPSRVCHGLSQGAWFWPISAVNPSIIAGMHDWTRKNVRKTERRRSSMCEPRRRGDLAPSLSFPFPSTATWGDGGRILSLAPSRSHPPEPPQPSGHVQPVQHLDATCVHTQHSSKFFLSSLLFFIRYL